MTQVPAVAADSAIRTTVIDRSSVRAALAEEDKDLRQAARDTPSRRQTATPVRVSPYALAIQRAVKKGIVEESVEAYSEVLIQCQKATSPVLTTPFMRSDAQQAHCYRF